ncbi:MAG: hypothetical protein K9H61_00545 [Bacteroidia bacterium]|nr:hypothetical protein [Bacteroidia bacterium]MCF8426248.1 hypothetical protein [Bacteroidia bacterium]MCF8445453.1 hypothetical protein [Bacteroidia bacterium]
MLKTFWSYGQTVEWGNPQKIKQKNLYSQIVGETSNGVFLLRCKTSDFTNEVLIEKYKTNLSLELSVPVPLSINGNIERVLLVNNDLHVFISAKNTQTNHIDILDQKLDATLKPVGIPNVICSFPTNQFIEKRRIQIKLSSDRTKVLMMFITKSSITGESKLNLYGYNDQIQQQFGKQFTLNEDPDDVFVTNYEIDNFGNAFVLIDFPSKEKKDLVDGRDFFLYAYYPIEDKMLAYELGNSQLFIEELGLVVNNFNHTVSVFGFYSEPGKNVINGYFYERFNIEKRTTEEKYAGLLDVEVLQQVTGGKIEKRNADLKNYYIRKIIPRSDGGVFFVAEKYTRIEQRFNYYLNNMPQEGVRITYNYDDAALISINPDGSIHFGDIIRKRQSSVGDGGYVSGIVTLATTDNIFILYNSELGTEGNIMAHNVNYQGKSDEKIAVKSSNFSVAIIPSEVKQTGPNTILAGTIKDKQYALMRITF